MRTSLLSAIALLLLVLSVACGGGKGATPTPSAPEGCAELETGVFLCAKDPPLLPPGATALSGYFELLSNEDTGLVVGLPLTAAQSTTVGIGFYSYSGATGWTGTIGAITLAENGSVLQGAFPRVPENLIVLRWPGGEDTASPGS